MRTKAARAVLFHEENSSMADDWIDHIEFRRSSRGTFEVWGNKFMENPVTGRRGWGEWYKLKDLRSPADIKSAIVRQAEFLDVDLDLADAISKIAEIEPALAAEMFPLSSQ